MSGRRGDERSLLQSPGLSMEAGDPDQAGQEMPVCWSLQHSGLAVGGAENKAAEAQSQCSSPWAYPSAQVSQHRETSREPKDTEPFNKGCGRVLKLPPVCRRMSE